MTMIFINNTASCDDPLRMGFVFKGNVIDIKNEKIHDMRRYYLSLRSGILLHRHPKGLAKI